MYIQSTFNQVLSFLIEGDRRYSFQTPHLSARPPRWYIISPPFTSHGVDTAIDIYEYPGPIVEATIIQATRLWRRKDSAFGGFVGLPGTGQTRVSAGLDPDVALLLGQYRKLSVGA